MLSLRNHLGEINISKRFFTQLISLTLKDCFGIAGTNACSPKQSLLESFFALTKKKFEDKGVAVRFAEEKLIIDLHITVVYGLNIASTVKSIQHKISYVIEEETDIEVESVNVFIDEIKPA